MAIYLSNTPTMVVFSSDDADPIIVTFKTNTGVVTIKNDSQELALFKEGELDWLYDRLSDVRSLVKAEREEKEKQNKKANP